MLEKFKQNKNEWYLHSLGFLLLAIVAIFKYEVVEISMVLFGISVILMGIGSLYNENKKADKKLNKILINQQSIISYLSGKWDNIDTKDILSQKELDDLLKDKLSEILDK